MCAKGGPAVGAKVERAPPVFGTSGKIPPHITAVAHKVRRAGGRPRMLYLPLGELSIYKAFFSDRVYEVSVAFLPGGGWILADTV